MAGFRVLYLFLLILVVVSVFANAQQPNRRRNPNRPRPANRQRKPGNGKPLVVAAAPPIKKVNKNRPNEMNNANANKKQKQEQSVVHKISGLGIVRGRTIKSEWNGKSIMQFFDIPYAKVSSGALRFKAPSPVAPWSGILKTEKPYYGCPSLQDDYDFDLLKTNNVDVEDCLRLTIHTKSLNDVVPVMVYIHGDFLYDGSPNQAAPGFLLEEDVVLVGIRYRLGPFGFLSTMTEEIPGNAAVFDVIAALKWIQEHISSFGGDPSRVTLFGQAGGAALINIMTMSPLVPDGLFHRVIYHSASALSPAFITDRPLAAAKDIGKHAGCKNVHKIDMLNRCLRKLNTTELLEAFSMHGAANTGLGVGSSGAAQFVVGGPSGILPQFPSKLLTDGKFKAYPTMGGATKNAGTLLLKDIFIDNFNQTIMDDELDASDYVKHIISETNGDDPSGAWKKYAEEEVFTASQLRNGSFYTLLPGLVDLSSTIAFKNPVLLALQGNAKKLPNSTYLYSFDYEGEQNRYSTDDDYINSMPFELGVSLTDDNLYLFPWPHHALIHSNRDIKVAKRMVALWTSFAANGKPSAPGISSWPAMTDDTGPYLKIDKTVAIGDNYIDEFNVAVRESNMGYNLVNEDFFDSLVEVNKSGEDGEREEETEEDEENDSDSSGSARGNIVIIAHRNKNKKS